MEELGFRKNEEKIYKYLLKKGSTTTGSIIKETKIANSRVYESLNTLIKKGLVTYTIQKDGKHFKAETPEKLRELEEERKKKVEKKIKELKQIEETIETPTTSAVYEGFEGFKTAFKKMIDDCPTKETIKAIGFSRSEYAHKSLSVFLDNINAKAISKKIKFKLILDETGKKDWSEESLKSEALEVRHMPKGFISPAATDVVGDYVYTFLWEEKPHVFMIKNKQIAKSFEKYFEFLWKTAKP